jgi:GNAT superfamily N-acetyltransferase
MPSAKSPVTVRPARREDEDVIGNLVVALAHYEKLDPPDETARARLIEDAFRPNPRVEIFLAEVSGQVVGYAFFFETYSTFLALPTLYLEDLFVLPEFRGVGAGYALMKYLAAEAARRGCGRLEWEVLDWNRPAIDFYERLGAKRLPDWLSYRLDRQGLERLAASD